MSIKPTNGKNKLSSGWSDLFAAKLYDQCSYCVINFKYHHLRKINSRKRNVPFCIAKSRCKFIGCCCEYVFKIKKKPSDSPKKTITVRVQRIGSPTHSPTKVHKRHTRKPEREKIATELQAESVSAWYYTAYAKLEDVAKMSGNISKPKTQAVLRKIKSQHLLEGNIHSDVLQEVKILNDVYKDIESPGFIRHLSIEPFQAHLYLNEQLQAYIKANKGHKGVLFLDATGSIIQKIPGQDGRIFLYSLVMKNPIEGRGALPVAEFLSNDQHSSEIKHFLGVLCNNLKLMTTKYIPRQVETDVSWAIIQAVVQTFNEHNLKAYLEFTWNIVQNKCSVKELKGKTYIHCCSAHMLQLFIRSLLLKKKDKGLSEFILRCLSCLLNCTSLEDARELFAYMCDVMIPKSESEQYHRSLKALKNIIKRTAEDEVDMESIDEHEVQFIEDEELEDTTVLKKSQFYRYR